MIKKIRFYMVGFLRLFKLFFESREILEFGCNRAGGVVGVYGWYGTETLGDKLILLGILRACFTSNKKRVVCVCTTNVEYTKKTISELAVLASGRDFKEFILNSVHVERQSFLLSLGEGDVALMGGGPIMDDPELIKWVVINYYFRLKEVRRLVVGCGIGPINMKASNFLVKVLVGLVDTAVFRPSPACYSEISAKGSASLCPSFIAWFDIVDSRAFSDREDRVVFHIREIPSNYLRASDGEVVEFNRKFKIKFTSICEQVLSSTNSVRLSSYSTHEHDLTGDSLLCDLISRKLHEMEKFSSVVVDQCAISNLDVLGVISKSKYSISTRYHGVVLSLLLGARVCGVDYTSGGGKLSALYSFLFPEKAPVNLKELIDGDGEFVSEDMFVELSQERAKQLAEDTLEKIVGILDANKA